MRTMKYNKGRKEEGIKQNEEGVKWRKARGSEKEVGRKSETGLKYFLTAE